MLRSIKALFEDERGATAIEYALIVALVFLAVLGSIGQVASSTLNMWTDTANKVEEVSKS